MKDWMLALPIALLTLSSTVNAEVNTDPKVLSDQLFRTGLAFCNEASKKSRTDTQLARADFANYESHLERAKAIYPQLMDENDFASREATRCELVDDNIARAEAMPLIEQGLAYCNEAKTRLEASSGVFEAETNLKQYKELRDQALETTPTILRVGSVAVQVRVCDGLDEKISLVENQMKRTHRETDKVIASFNKAMDTCQVGTGMLKGATSNPETVEAAGQVLNQLTQYQENAEQQASALLRKGNLGADSKKRLSSLKSDLNSCYTSMTARIDLSNKRIQARAEWLVQREAAEQAKLAAQAVEDTEVAQPEQSQQAIAKVEVETPETPASAQEPLLQGSEVAHIGTGEL